MAFVITACTATSAPTTAPTAAPTAAPRPTSVTPPTNLPPAASPTTNAAADETNVPVDWKTYTSPHYGYAIEHPTNWEMAPAKRDWPSDNGTYPDDDAVDKWGAPASDPWILMFVLSVQLAKGESAADRIAKLDQDNAGSCELGHRHDVTIDGVAARQEDGKCFGGDYISQIAVVHSGRFYFIYLLSGSPFTDTTLATFNRFVASFRFVGGP